MLAREPILLLLTLYMSLLYGIVYLFFETYPISFQEERGWTEGIGALPFASLGVGVFIGCLIIIGVTKTRFKEKLEKHGHVIPEERLPPMILGSIFLPIGLFWYAWTSSPDITWVPQVLASALVGCGIMLVFMQGMSYIIDVYLWQANSALAANTFLRSAAGAGFPLFATAMFRKLGVAWATSLIGFLCILMIPAPICFYFYGGKIRRWSKFSGA
jgi:DHA1 family multidrug resistance protein-like MFS transporter